MTALLRPRIGYYGDDFTGATDTLATAARGGLRAALFLRVPDDAQLAAAGPLDCVGVAGAARALPPPDMQAELAPVAAFFNRLAPPLLHYKLCSTFDSAPHVGNIAVALQALRRGRPNPLVAIVGGQPSLGRYCVFGNLFATEQAGGAPQRLDRHRNMSRHPVTPMDEADLRRHLARQGLANVAAMHYPDYDLDAAAQDARLDALLARRPQAVLFDVGHDSHLRHVGRILWTRARRQPLLAAGASSVVQALLAHWRHAGEPPGEATSADGTRLAPAQGPVLVLAGSMSPVTATQIAASPSYRRIALDAARLAAGEPGYADETVTRLCAELRQGHSIIAHTTPLEAAQGHGAPAARAAAELASASAALLRRVLCQCPGLRRIGVAGGDTSSRAMQALDIQALRYLATPAPGVAVCQALAADPTLDGMQIMLKGGQMGPPDLFEILLRGTR